MVAACGREPARRDGRRARDVDDRAARCGMETNCGRSRTAPSTASWRCASEEASANSADLLAVAAWTPPPPTIDPTFGGFHGGPMPIGKSTPRPCSSALYGRYSGGPSKPSEDPDQRGQRSQGAHRPVPRGRSVGDRIARTWGLHRAAAWISEPTRLSPFSVQRDHRAPAWITRGQQLGE